MFNQGNVSPAIFNIERDITEKVLGPTDTRMFDFTVLLLGITSVISMLLIVVCSIFDSRESERQLKRIGAHSSFHDLSHKRAAILQTTQVFLNGLYGNTRILPNFWRIASIGLLLNLSIFLFLANSDSFLMTDGENPTLNETLGITINVILIISIIVTEFLTVISTRYFLRLAVKHSSFYFIIIDLLFLSFGFYIIPVFLLQNWAHINISPNCNIMSHSLSPKQCLSIHPTEFIILFDWDWLSAYVSTPIMSFLMFTNELYFSVYKSHDYSNLFSIFLPAFSLCLPSFLVILATTTLYFNSVAKFLSWVLARISRKKIQQIRYYSIIVFTLATGFSSYISLVLSI